MSQADQRAPWRVWGDNIDAQALAQMDAASRLPVAVAGALMPDAHVGYGLPIGGVLACDNAVIPYGVGVDIACRVKLSALDIPAAALRDDRQRERLIGALREETRFGVGVEFKPPRRHSVMELDWSASPVTNELKDKAWRQLGTSGSGNHFVEWGLLRIDEPALGLDAGEYLALFSHSGSRGVGAAVCQRYSKIASDLRADLPPAQRHLAWLDLDSSAGAEYWAAMNLMGEYASANHAVIHREIARNLGAQIIASVENHHNFAWLEEHDGRRVVVHRKGATPADRGGLGVIPGTMVHPAYIVRGKGDASSLRSSAHGAGRVMSRRQAKKTFRWPDVRAELDRKGVTLLSAGLDEAPGVYKNINQVMRAQQDLVDIVARFTPRIVKMAPAGERPED